MIKNIKTRVLPKVWSDSLLLKRYLSEAYALDFNSIQGIRTLHQSVDARQRQVMIQLDLEIYINEQPPSLSYQIKQYREVNGDKSAIVVGAGPAGLFACLKLIEHGVKPILLERGKNVTERRRDVASIGRTQSVDPESNYCFGEGGAGAFSDGKLFTRSKKRGNVHEILHLLCQFGANPNILIDAHPHIGTDCLPAIIANIREEILRCGGEVHFNSCVTDLLVHNLSTDEPRVRGVVLKDGSTIEGPVILATGHSARDVYKMLYAHDIALESKGIAMGVRLEHPQKLIDQIQYHNPKGRGEYLPPAEYSFVTQANGRGVYSFCMCPGGVIVPSATGPEQVVVNGMSASLRGSKWANAAMVVEIRPEDMQEISSQISIDERYKGTPIEILCLQETLEQQTWINGGNSQVAPAQRMADFVNGRLSSFLPPSSYAPGVVASPLHFWMPRFITSRLQEGFRYFGKRAKGFLTNDAMLIASETRTSSPVRIPRDKDNLNHVRVRGLYPCGEGAGYAGGIVSAAMDGQRVAEALVGSLMS